MDDLISKSEALNTKYIVKSINGVDYVMLSEVQMKLRKQPSAQPSYTDEQIQKMQELEQAEIEKAFQLGREDALSEIIRCKDCKYYEIAWLKKDFTDDKRYKPSICVNGRYGITRKPDWFCADAERRTDE